MFAACSHSEALLYLQLEKHRLGTHRVISPWSDFLGEGGHYCVKVLKVKMPLSLNNGAMAYWLRCWITNLGVPCSNPLRDSKDNSAFHPSEVDQMYTRNSWELSGKSQTAST